MDRRKALTSALTLVPPCWVALHNPIMTKAVDDEPSSNIFIKGMVTLKSNISLPPEECSNSALYITARPLKPDDVPRAILDGSSGKPPPVLASRIANPTFPLHFELRPIDLTVEGATKLNTMNMDPTKFWFEGIDFIVSARWDTDGVAATRDPTDLVGRAEYLRSSSNGVTIQLTGRGLTGKVVTSKNKK